MNDKVIACIYAAIDEANLERTDVPPLVKAPETVLQGTSDGLDSLGLINFIVTVEENVEEELGVMITLGDDRALAQDPSPFRSVEALADYVGTLLGEQG